MAITDVGAGYAAIFINITTYLLIRDSGVGRDLWNLSLLIIKRYLDRIR